MKDFVKSTLSDGIFKKILSFLFTAITTLLIGTSESGRVHCILIRQTRKTIVSIDISRWMLFRSYILSTKHNTLPVHIMGKHGSHIDMWPPQHYYLLETLKLELDTCILSSQKVNTKNLNHLIG